ncbi:MAG: ABC-2 family transporter protein [Candidatus Micrarchaeota archaeon]
MKSSRVGFPNINAYISMLIIGMKNELAYRLDFIISLFFRFINVLFMILIWSAIYLGTGVASIRGLSLPDMYVYFFITYALRGVVNMQLPEVIESDIQEGSIATAYIRPLRYPIQAYIHGAADDIMTMLFVTAPFFAIAVLLAHVTLTLGTALLLLFEILLGYVLANLIGFLLGITAIKLINIGSLEAVTESALLLLGGGIVPLNMMPHIVQQILYLSPFAIMLYIPAATFLGTVSRSIIVTNILASLAWIALLTVVAFIAWGKVRTQITSAGG